MNPFASRSGIEGYNGNGIPQPDRYGQIIQIGPQWQPQAGKPKGIWLVIDAPARTICTVSPDGVVQPWVGAADGVGHRDGAGAEAGFLKPAFVAIRPAPAKGDWELLVSDSRGHTLRQVDSRGQVSTFAGQPGKESYRDGDRSIALFAWPAGVAVDPEGTVYVCDAGNYVIRRIARDGQVTTLAGGPYEYGHRDGRGAEARFHRLRGLALDDRNGQLYAADGHSVRRISPDGEVSTVLGNVKEPGFEEWMARPATGQGLGGVRCLNEPWGLALHAGLLFIADKNNHAIRIFHPETGDLRTLVGDPTQGKTRYGNLRNGAPRNRPKQYAALAQPSGIAFDSDGTCLVTTGSSLARIEPGPHGFELPVAGLTVAPWPPVVK